MKFQNNFTNTKDESVLQNNFFRQELQNDSDKISLVKGIFKQRLFPNIILEENENHVQSKDMFCVMQTVEKSNYLQEMLMEMIA